MVLLALKVMPKLIIPYFNTGLALQSATNSLSGGLKPLSEEDEANNDPKAEDKLMIESGTYINLMILRLKLYCSI
jgi:hypothetical protein